MATEEEEARGMEEEEVVFELPEEVEYEEVYFHSGPSNLKVVVPPRLESPVTTPQAVEWDDETYLDDDSEELALGDPNSSRLGSRRQQG